MVHISCCHVVVGLLRHVVVAGEYAIRVKRRLNEYQYLSQMATQLRHRVSTLYPHDYTTTSTHTTQPGVSVCPTAVTSSRYANGCSARCGVKRAERGIVTLQYKGGETGRAGKNREQLASV